jgi:diaminopimelate epimerase
MQLDFYKYQGTGNDFVLVDNRHMKFPKDDASLVRRLCDRKFGIGADGLILLEGHDTLDFSMVYYNADGNLSSMCGNGGRCLAHLAISLGIGKDRVTFEAVDGVHTASVQEDHVSLTMGDAVVPKSSDGGHFVDTGSPHHVLMVEELENFPVDEMGSNIRNEVYGPHGANVNFVQPMSEGEYAVRTYERGVEAETLSCGTGVTAVAIVLHHRGEVTDRTVHLSTPGGKLEVSFTFIEGRYTNVVLSGEVKQVYTGSYKWNN